MKKILILLFIPFICIGQLKFLPESKGELVEHNYYSLSYVEKHEQAEWVHYRLDPTRVSINKLNGKKFKTDRNYYQDKTFESKSAHKDDIKFKVDYYQKGHLAPAADMKMNLISVREAVYMSNISPQKKDFNGGRWKKLESLVRAWAKKNEIFITTAGLLNDNDLKKIGSKNRVSVPREFYKLIYMPSENKMIAFLMPNQKINGQLKDYVVSVDKVEELTGIDFYSELDDVLEEKLEAEINPSKWNF